MTEKCGCVIPTGIQSLNQTDDSIIFIYEVPTCPSDLWLSARGEKPKQITYANSDFSICSLPEVRTIKYMSEGVVIEGLLVTPNTPKPQNGYPTLVFLHSGPESRNKASFSELISARSQSAAFWLASNGFCVFLPNYRGSTGYGSEFTEGLQNYRLTEVPFLDVMAGMNHLVEQGISDPCRCGIYGSSFGGWLTSWIISKTNFFRGAVSVIGFYDILHRDRSGGRSFFSLRENRLGNADPQAMWNSPLVYNRFSPLENASFVKTPTLLIETGAELSCGVDSALTFYNNLDFRKIETYIVYYPIAFHGGGWNDIYKEDYLRRLLAWFNHCIDETNLPEWFNEGNI